ncbi:hydantoinase/oxoprolinase family protein [bacterium]|nr:hydantoinase/oxoprolinase family protein [bacterium]
MQTGAIRIGVDTGGTFTDLVLDAGPGRGLLTHKLLSTPADPGRAVLIGIAAILEKLRGLGGRTDATPDVIHGSTVATNALLEGKVARAAFVTTAGFEDVPWIGRQNRPRLYELEPQKPQPPLGRDLAVGVPERLRYDGVVLEPLQPAALVALVHRLRGLDVDSIAVCLLHSYANPRHEQLIAERLAADLPELHMTLSSVLLPEFREYERASTCLVNAAVAPVMGRYIGRLADELGRDRLRVMASAGGSLPPDVVAREPVHTIVSGPAGGVVGAATVARVTGVERFVTLDMGGTSTDVSLYHGGLTYTTEGEIAGLPVKLPMLDIHTVGAGGGSIAWIDAGGALHVGPESTGAEPGPACYGRQQPPYRATVTDAHVVLGHLPGATPLGGGLVLDGERARAAVGELAREAGLTLLDAAAGILRVAEVTMARAVQRISVERGFDLRELALMPFGGAGGLHAARLAEQLGMPRVVVPRDPGLLSAIGMLAATPLYNFSQAVMRRIGAVDGPALANEPSVQAALAAVVEKARHALDAEGIPRDRQIIESSLDLRYTGQSYEITVPVVADPAAEFAQRHERLYGYRSPERELMVVAARARARAVPPELPPLEIPQRGGPLPAGLCQRIELRDQSGAYAGVSVARDDLLAGDCIVGPAVIREYSATTLVPAGWYGSLTTAGHIMLDRLTAGCGDE